MAGLPKPLLSICLPTRNRAVYLEPHLRELTAPDAFPFPIEIIIGDNGSEDDTARIVEGHIAAGAPIRYVRHERDLGFQANLYAIFRLAEGEFSIYLADDDRLVASALAEAIALLQRRPELVALYGPWEGYDSTTKAVTGRTFVLPEPLEYGPRDRLALLQTLLDRNIIPEVPLIRTRVLGATLFRSTHIYWPYTLLDRLLDSGGIVLTGIAFYRVIAQHWPGETRSSVLHRWTPDDWENCRRGLDYFFWRARCTSPSLSPADEAVFRDLIAERGRFYLSNAMYGRYTNHDFVGATEIGMLVAAAGIWAYPETRQLSRVFAASDLLFEVLDATPGTSRVALFGFQAPAAITQLLTTRRPGTAVDVMPQPDPTAFDGHLVVAADGRHRDALLQAGFAQGRVIDFERLLAFVTIPEAAPAAPGGTPA